MKDKNTTVEIIAWLIIASLVVLIVMNAGGFAQAVSSIGGVVTGESSILTGSGYQKSK